jgi:hypothetical protein
MLPEKRWRLLDVLADGPQPLEKVQAEYAAFAPAAVPEDLTADLSELQADGLITLAPQARPASGLWVSATPKGEAEWDDPRYTPYWKEPVAAQPGKDAAFPVRAQYAVAGLCLLLMGIALWGVSISSSSLNDRQVNLGACLMRARATLAEANAPAEVLHDLDWASQPNAWQSDALSRLNRVNQALDKLPMAVQEQVRPDFQQLISVC